MRRKIFSLSVILLISSTCLFSQHDHHPSATTPKRDTTPAKNMHEGHDMNGMYHTYSLHLPMNRNGSGTSWFPDATPMYMYMTGNNTKWMIHGNVFLRYTNTDIFNKGHRGNSTFDAPNWFMGMMNKPVGKKGLLSAKAMVSLDPWTEGGDGYPLLFQSGETHKGQRLVDRQHPHDLFSELSIGYSYSFDRNTDLFAYAAYPGEPAFGPPAFMHRISAMNIPDAPLGHHWQDATHITYGVGTLGFRYRELKIEGSIFTGREPDEKRYDFDEPLFDSYSFRLSFNPSKNWALQFSRAFIEEPEVLEPGEDVVRTSASMLYSRTIGKENHYTGALIWGVNDKDDNETEHSFLQENNFQFGRNALYSRYEFVQKSTHELELEDDFGHKIFDIHALSIGYNRVLLQKRFVELTAGTLLTVNFPAMELKSLYGNLPVGWQIYLQLRPSRHQH